MADINLTITEAQIKGLEDAIKNAPVAGLGATQQFCQIWPSAKQGLEVLKGVLVLVPGAGLLAQGAISIVIAAGDAASSALCKP